MSCETSILTVGISTTRALRVLFYSALPFELIVLCVKILSKTSHYTSAIMSLLVSINAYEVLLLLESTTTSTSRKAFYYYMDSVSSYFTLFETMLLLFHFPNITSPSILRVLFAVEYYWRAFARAHINSSSAVDMYHVFCHCIGMR